MKKIILILAVILGFCFLLSECNDPKKVAVAKEEERLRIIALAPPPPQISLTVYPDRMSERVNPWEKFGSGVTYEIARSGAVWIYPDGNTNKGVLGTPSNTVNVGSPWTLTFRSVSEPVEVIIRKK